jgi:hypothetical protein
MMTLPLQLLQLPLLLLLLLPGCCVAHPLAPPPPLGLVQIPGYHMWPRTVESQDISGPIGIVDPATNATTWHVFVDCSATPQDKAGYLEWCHLYSHDLVSWIEAPLAMNRGPPGTPDSHGLDTGSVFQLPNGTVYAVYEACNATYNDTARVAAEGDICYARARDLSLMEWDKLCYAPDALATGGQIQNPTCAWCRGELCPARCGKNSGHSKAPSPFPTIKWDQGMRDPSAPWLAPCNSTSPPGAPKCWYQPIASGGVAPKGQKKGQPTVLMYKNNAEMSGPWELAVPTGQVNEKTVWWGNGHPVRAACCGHIVLLTFFFTCLFQGLPLPASNIIQIEIAITSWIIKVTLIVFAYVLKTGSRAQLPRYLPAAR